MRKAITLLIVTSLVLTTLWLSSPPGSAQQSNKKQPDPDDPVLKSLKKNWDRLPPQARRAADPRAKAAWEKLTPRQHEALRAKILEIISTETEKYKKDKTAAQALLKTWDDVIRREGPNSGEDETLTFIDEAGKSRSVKARRRDASMKPNPGTVEGSGRLKALPKPVWETDWAVANRATVKTSSKSHHATGSTKAARLSPAQAGCTRGPEQFVRTFYGGLFNSTSYEGALARPPSASELSSWLNTLAQAQSQGTQVSAAQNLAYAVFQSPEYASRGRSNRDFVYDCYVAFLQRLPEQAGWDFWTAQADAHGQAAVLPGFGLSLEFYNVVNSFCNVTSFDGDQDGLPDNFENNLADAFTPQYHTSYDEPDNYSTMQDFVPQTLKHTFDTNPVSHFRVTPVTVTTNPHTGQLQSYLRIDYLTLWDHDSGLVGGWGCGLAGLFLSGILSHPLDDERSALLVAAPAPNGTFNTDPNAYQSVSLYTAAHENTFVDHSEYYDFPTSPMPAGYHVPLWSSLQKHSTYTFDPDWMPILEIYLQIIIWQYIEYYFGYGCQGWFPGDPFWDDYGFQQMCTDQYYYVYYEVYFIIYTCAVERFHSGSTQGLVSLAPTRINVGEPALPINGSTFIQDNSSTGFHLRDKLLTPLRFETNIP